MEERANNGHPLIKPGIAKQRFDSLLEHPYIEKEFKDTFLSAVHSRSPVTEIKKPRPRFLSEFHAAIYSPQEKCVYEGEWNDPHFQIAKNKSMTIQKENDPSNIYFSCYSFGLKGTLGARVLLIDNPDGLTSEDLINIQNAGFEAMDPYFQWMVLNPKSKDSYDLIPSALHQQSSLVV